LDSIAKLLQIAKIWSAIKFATIVVRLITYITVDNNNATQAHKRTIVSLLDSVVAKLLQIAKIWSAIKFATNMWFD
jgi:hypothetical protein